MRPLLRRVLGLAPLRLGREEALVLARQAAQDQGLPWDEPVRVRETFRGFEFWTAATMRGGNVSVEIDGVTGEVRSVEVSPR